MAFIFRKKELKNNLSIPYTYVVFDLETTGTDRYNCKIIELSAIKYIEGKETDSFSTLIKQDEKLDDEIVSLTGITDSMLQDAPYIEERIEDFYNFIKDDCLVGYNIMNFDIPILDRFLIKNHLPYLKNECIDVYKNAKEIIPIQSIKNYKQKTIAEYLNIPVEDAHRSLIDCEICNEIFLRLCGMGEIKREKAEIPKSKFPQYINASSFKPTKEITNTNHPLYGMSCVFTGELKELSREQAMQAIIDLGAIPCNTVTGKTAFLIVGEYSEEHERLYGKSIKYKKAEELKKKGYKVNIINEEEFLSLISI